MLTEFQIGITKAHSIIQRTFAFIVTTARRPMLAEKFFSVALSVPHVQPVIRPAKILKKNDANAWTKHRTFVIDAPKRSITAQSHINTIITDVLPPESIVNY